MGRGKQSKRMLQLGHHHHGAIRTKRRKLVHQDAPREESSVTNSHSDGASITVSGETVGIDLGTTYSCVGVWQNDRVEIIANDQGNRTTPSYVAFTDTERLIGDAAKSQAAMNAKNTVFDAKRLIGRKFSDATVQSDLKQFPFKVTSSIGGVPVIEVEYKGESKQFKAEEI